LLDELGYDPDDGVPQLVELDTSDASPGAARAAAGVPGVPGGLIDVPIGRVVAARDGARAVAVARLESGRLVVVADECPHDGGRISDGFVSGELLVCARHGWELETCAGKCVRAPRS
jgi:nitrite reductase/ring-hydroxylating ferredoxin subunit